MQHPCPLLVVEGVELLRDVGEVRVDDGGRVFPVELLHGLDAARHARLERGRALEPLVEEGVEVGREAFRHPEVIPVAGGHGIAEPLVSDLVGNGGLGDRLLLAQAEVLVGQ